MDLNGILHVSAREKETGLEKSITINNAIARFQEGEIDVAKARVRALFGDDDAGFEPETAADSEAEEHHVQVKGRALVEKAQTLLEKASDEDREDMIDLIEQIKDGLAGKDFAAVEVATNKLADIVYYLDA